MDKIKWCEHIRYEGNEYRCNAVNKDYFVGSYWNFCPICGKPKPKPQDEVDLQKIIGEWARQLDGKQLEYCNDGVDILVGKLLQWKRGS